MALGRYSRIDRSSSTSFGSTVTILVFVGLCLLGVWMMTSSSVVPDPNVDDVPKTHLDDQVNNSNATTNTLQFEDNPGDLPEDARKGDSNVSMAKDDARKGDSNVSMAKDDARKGDSNVSMAKDDARKGDSNVSMAKDDATKGDSNVSMAKDDARKGDSNVSMAKDDATKGDSNVSMAKDDATKGDSNVSMAKDDATANLNTQENKLDESKKDKQQLDSQGRWTNNNIGQNLPEDARKSDSQATLAFDDGTGNFNTQQKEYTEEDKLDESKKDKQQLDSAGGQTNNRGENLPQDARKGDSNVSLDNDNGTDNLNTQENNNSEEGKLDESKKDKKHLDSEGGQRNNGEDVGRLGGSEQNSDEKKSDREEGNKKAIFNENDEKSDSGSDESKPAKSSSETNRGKVDGQIEGKVDHNDNKDSEGGQTNNNSGNNFGGLADSEGGQTNNNNGNNFGGLADSEGGQTINNNGNNFGGLADSEGGQTISNNGNNFGGLADSEGGQTINNRGNNLGGLAGSEENPDDKNGKKFDSSAGRKKPYETSSETNGAKVDGQLDQNDKKVSGKTSNEAKGDEVYSSGAQSELLSENITQNGSFSTQAAVSKNEKKAQLSSEEHNWKLCNSTAGPDYIPCLDNWGAIKHLRTTKHYEHRERHCPEEPPTCLVPLPVGYKSPIKWPKSRERIWYRNVPHTELAKVKGHQNWVKFSGEYLTFPGGGTQFKHGALLYIDFIEESVPDIAWGKRSRVVLDVGCGVASFGGFLFDKNVLTMSLAPKDEHEAQVQFALERGIPAVSAVMGTKKLPYPGRVFDIVHCARCRVPWHIEGGKLLLELNRLLRPGGFFVWSAFPVYQKIPEDVEIWKAMVKLTKAMCWELVNKTGKDPVNRVGVAVFKKPTSNDCYSRRSKQEPPLCPESDDPNAAWNVSLKTCMHKVPVDASERGYKWPEQWPARLEKSPYWLLSSQVGVYGKPAPEDFAVDYKYWKRVVKSYVNNMGINWSTVRNVMDMKAIYGGFAAALKDLDLWVMNVVPIRAPDTLPIIYERGLFGIYHDWCESFSSYPRSYDLLHADHLFSKVKKRCNIVSVIAEVDRVLRPGGKLIVRDNVETINELEKMLRSMHWEVGTIYSKDKEGLLCVKKSMWRPKEVETIVYAIN